MLSEEDILSEFKSKVIILLCIHIEQSFIARYGGSRGYLHHYEYDHDTVIIYCKDVHVYTVGKPPTLGAFTIVPVVKMLILPLVTNGTIVSQRFHW